MKNIISNSQLLKIIKNIVIIMFIMIFILACTIATQSFINKEELIKTSTYQTKNINKVASKKYSNIITVILENKQNSNFIENKVNQDEVVTLNTEQSLINDYKNIEIKTSKNNESINEVDSKKVDTKNQNIEINQKDENQYEGYSSIGKIEIPQTNVNLPIFENVTVGGMEVAPCKLYSTGELNVSGNTMIVGHNYRNNTIFSNNGKLQNGDSIYITDLNGNTLEYKVYDKFITTAEDVSYLKRDTGEKPEITLQCCTDDDEKRIILLAIAI